MVARKQEQEEEGQPGVAVDAHGGGVVDPTKNVGDLVKAEAKKRDDFRDNDKELLEVKINSLREHLNAMREASTSFQNFARESESRLSAAETRRIDQLAVLRQDFQNTIRDMLAESVRTTSALVSTQLMQIQATFDTRVSKLEAFQFTQAGRSSALDPQMSDALTRLTLGLANLKTNQDDATANMAKTLSAIQNTESRTGGAAMGRDAGNARFFAIVMAIAAVAGPLIAVSGIILTR